MAEKKVVVIAGPTGSGETTFTNELTLAYPRLCRLITATTRPPRTGEHNGKDYYFFTKEQFFEGVQNGNIPEHTRVRNRDALYGTYLPELERRLAEGYIVIVNTDLHGARFHKYCYDATTIFIKPKSLDVLRNRITRRDPNISEEEVNHRIAQALEEINAAEDQYDYVVYNTDGEFAETMVQVVDILKREGYDLE